MFERLLTRLPDLELVGRHAHAARQLRQRLRGDAGALLADPTRSLRTTAADHRLLVGVDEELTARRCRVNPVRREIDPLRQVRLDDRVPVDDVDAGDRPPPES